MAFVHWAGNTAASCGGLHVDKAIHGLGPLGRQYRRILRKPAQSESLPVRKLA